MYEPTSGQILIDDIPINTIDVVHYRKHIGLVTQEPKLFNASIRENIEYGLDEPVDEVYYF